jgi:hypothetical protein
MAHQWQYWRALPERHTDRARQLSGGRSRFGDFAAPQQSPFLGVAGGSK